MLLLKKIFVNSILAILLPADTVLPISKMVHFSFDTQNVINDFKISLRQMNESTPYEKNSYEFFCDMFF